MDAPVQDRVYHLQSPDLPLFRFEWHPGVQRVYLVHVGATPEIGTPISNGVTSQRTAEMVVGIWVRGYLEAKNEIGGSDGRREQDAIH